MNGKKAVIILVSIIVGASLAAVISIMLFFKYYEPKPANTENATSLTLSQEQFIITLNSR